MNESTSGMREFGQYLENVLTAQKPEIIQHEGRPYLLTKNGLTAILDPRTSMIEVATLTGLVDYIKSGIDEFNGILIHVVSPTKVELLSRDHGQHKQRDVYMTATAAVPRISFDSFMNQESFIIQSQSCFIHNMDDDLDIVVACAGNIRESAVKDILDDGVSQVVSARSGVARLSDVVVPKQVLLTPIRTFTEIAQPSSSFVFRIQDGPKMALFEADGGAWKNEAMRGIKEYLTDELKDFSVSIIA